MANLKVTVETEYNGKGIKQAQAEMNNLGNKSIKQLKEELKDLQKNLERVKPNGTTFQRYSREIAATRQQLKLLQQQSLTTGNALNTNMGGATSAVIEFNRVIQDAPFGIVGVGNNIQALTQNLGYLVSTTGSARKATSIFFSTLISPANLAVLAISALTTAWTIYERQSQKAAKADKERLKNMQTFRQEMDDFAESLGAVDRATVKAAGSTSEEITKLRILYERSQDVSRSMAQREKAVNALQKIFPEYFKNISDEAILAGNAQSAYERLTQSIKATGIAMAAISIQGDNNRQLVQIGLSQRQIERQRETSAKNLLSIQRQLEQSLGRQVEMTKEGLQYAAGLAARDDDRQSLDLIAAASRELSKQSELTAKRTKEGLEELRLKREQLDLDKLINEQLDGQADLTGRVGKNLEKTKKTATEMADAIAIAMQKANDSVDSTGLRGNDKEVEKVRQEYAKLYRDIQKYVEAQAKKGIDVRERAAKAVTALQILEAREQANIAIEEQQRVADEVQRILNDSGVASAQTMEKELAAVVKWYDEEVKKAEGNAQILAAIEEGAQARRDAIRAKYHEKYVQGMNKLYDKIREIEDRNFAQNRTGLASDTKKLQEEINKRIKAINAYYDKLQAMQQGGLLGYAIIEGQRAVSTGNVTQRGNAANDNTDLFQERALNRAINSFTSSMYDSLASIGKTNEQITEKYNNARANATEAEIARLNEMEKREKAIANSFGNIFSGIFDTFTSSMEVFFKNEFTNLIKANLSKGLEDLNLGGLPNKISTALVAGAALAGSAISSIGGGRNTLTSSLGGALSGAASGAVIGSAIPGVGTLAGAIVGGLGGVISGIFGSSSRRKQEELERRQLEEQRRTNALLERQQRLAYSSQVIGRMTERGVITGVDVNEFGELTATIAGNDIVLSYDRTKKKQNRGNG